MEACEHGNPMDASCKLCGRVGTGPRPDAVNDPLTGERNELLAIAFALLVGVDAKKAGLPPEWAESFTEWQARYATIDPARAGAA